MRVLRTLLYRYSIVCNGIRVGARGKKKIQLAAQSSAWIARSLCRVVTSRSFICILCDLIFLTTQKTTTRDRRLYIWSRVRQVVCLRIERREWWFFSIFFSMQLHLYLKLQCSIKPKASLNDYICRQDAMLLCCSCSCRWHPVHKQTSLVCANRIAQRSSVKCSDFNMQPSGPLSIGGAASRTAFAYDGRHVISIWICYVHYVRLGNASSMHFVECLTSCTFVRCSSENCGIVLYVQSARS